VSKFGRRDRIIGLAARCVGSRPVAKARGVRFGRPAKLPAHQRQKAIQRLQEGATQADLARTYGVSQATAFGGKSGPIGLAAILR